MKKSYIESLSYTTWECKYHIVFAPKFRICDDFILWSESHTSYELNSLSERIIYDFSFNFNGSMVIFCSLLYNDVSYYFYIIDSVKYSTKKYNMKI